MLAISKRHSIKIFNKSISFNVFFFTLLISTFSVLLAAFLLYKTKPKIVFSLIGDKKTEVAVNTEYEDEGIKLFLKGKEVSLSDKNVVYKVISNVDYTKVGKYRYTYNITYKDKNYELIRTIYVKDYEKPEIKVNVEEIVVYSCTSLEDIKFDYSSIDNYDGDLTDKVHRKNKDDYVMLYVEDSSGNESEVLIPVVYKDEIEPVITLNDGNASLNVGGTYEEKGATAKNTCGVDLSDKIKIEGTVDTNTIGTYEIKYSVETDSGLTSTTTRKVSVLNPEDVDKGNKVVYLTFDDGPGKYTAQLLDILKKYNVKATFFVTAQFGQYVPLIEREAAEGHSVAVHTKTHQWSIYKSLDTYMEDFNLMNDIIEQYTGKRSNIFRFPGGSSNTVSCGANAHTLPTVVDHMNALGIKYFDWNVDSRDAEGKSSEQIKTNIINGTKNRNNSVVLCHDIKANTVNVMEEYIQYALEHGYIFKTLDENSPVVHHGINKCHYK